MRHENFNERPQTRRRSAGMTLIELMVALAIGSFLMIGAVQVFMQSRTTFRVTESVARLHEDARFALDQLEPDIRMASYWGLTTRASRIDGRAAPDETEVLTVGNTCEPNWAVNLTLAVEASDNGYPAAYACTGPEASDPDANSDTLVVRRVAEEPVPDGEGPQAGTLYVQSARFQNGKIFVGPERPSGFTAVTSKSYRLIVNGYYVSAKSTVSTGDDTIPSLRIKTLSGGPAITDQEVLPGVEDMQVQFGIDTDPPGAANRGIVDRYVDPGDDLLDPQLNPDVKVLAVRLWLRIRAERQERGFTDTVTYRYADQAVGPFNDAYRRLVVSKTIYLRNARPAS